MEPEILKFEDILRGCMKRWKSILIVAIFTTILGALVSGTSKETITYQGNFKTLIRSDVIVTDNGTVVKKEPNLIQNLIELMKTRNFAENAIKRTDLNLTAPQVLGALTLVNIERSDFVQVKYSSENEEQTKKIITAIRDELLDVAEDYNEDATVSIEENVGIIEKADIRNNKILIVIGFVGGFGLAFIVSFILECINKTFKTKGEIERELKLPIIVNIPKIKKTSPKLVSKNTTDFDFNKAFNSLAAEIKYGKNNSKVKSIAITSSVSGEGSTIVAINLAIALSNSNKTLLIDTNYNNNKTSEIFGINSNIGLKEVIFDHDKLEDVIVKKNDNLHIISTGDVNVNTMSLLDSKVFDELLKELNKDYDYIIVDTPAVQASADTKLLLRKVDGSILVVKAESTKKDIIKSTINDINNLSSNLMGIAFNFGDRFRNKYYTYKIK
ncbi:MAG: polysaccharide biosynthesis tyrosine autokinase [Clostridium sp.]|uniref:polysaccharide biosynthesis tyrosine autokinase n=1 Tax=Clostridium sp. TaxID=1506 RepID=UPI0025C38479|nr:polysaccharide biosynthesis tyrosine autokinase [Clostridium sp.]MCF0147272.1 polysaccharide biosynthesis tyrosine autokinase [Clostridium sp.]